MMPREKIHEGSTFTLIPMKEPDGSPSEDYREFQGWLDPEFQPEGAVVDHRPDAYLSWSKARSDGGDDPGDQGYVMLQMEVTPETVRRWLKGYDRMVEHLGEAAPARITFEVGPLTWRDMNYASKAIPKARDDAFGQPQ